MCHVTIIMQVNEHCVSVYGIAASFQTLTIVACLIFFVADRNINTILRLTAQTTNGTKVRV
jgi:hypothetical protein